MVDVVTSAPYLAGFVDADGSVRIKDKKQKGVIVEAEIANKDFSFLRKIQQEFGGYLRIQTHNNCGHLIFRKKESKQVLNYVYHYLYTKKRRAQLALEFLEQEHSRRDKEILSDACQDDVHAVYN